MTTSRPDRLPPEHAPVAGFPLNDNELVVGGIPLTRLAARAGRTPFYAYDRKLLTERVAELRGILPSGVMLHYAMKANPMPALVGHMARLVDGLDVASAGELRVALDAGTSAQDISFAGPGKTANELLQAVAAGILVNIESFREVDLLEAASRQLGLAARVAVRVNPDFELKSSGMKMGGGPRPFGVDAEQAPALLGRIRDAGLAFEGFHLFAGSQNLKSEAIIEAQRQSYALALRLAEHAPAPIRNLNLGGGFGIPYFPGEQRLDPSPIAANLAELQADASSRWQGARLVIELGRYLVGEAGIYVCRVLDRKVSRGQVFLVTDGGMHHHLAASGNFGQIIRKNYPVAVGNRMASPGGESATVVGPLCTPLDVLGDKLPLAHARPEDLIVVFQSGAYGASASPQGFLGHPAPLELLV
ncbi:MAG: pyridoxal-dependent decarboxylase, exosortase A system-associated [Rhodocyclales bacterium]|nr:pyridoxal-dependent decarboxylase, exosortase A system-associated [Rhodocyclales bacterium]